MAEIKVTDVYGEGEAVGEQPVTSADHVIVSEELRDVLGLSSSVDEEATTTVDLNEMCIVGWVEQEMITGLVYGDLISLSSGEYLTLRFNAKSKCDDMLRVLKTSTSDSIERVTIDVTGDYGFHVTSTNIEAWEMRILDDRSALLTLTMGTNDVIFR